ncbi:MAG: hypothetical protein IT269_03455 [Saprospiraceae bacterium]|nr:hypothetical protein [Saprospiraceae bacterium]
MKSPKKLLYVLLTLILGVLVYRWFKHDTTPQRPLTIRIDEAAKNLNPILSKGHGPSIYLAQQIFQTLAMINPTTLELEPMLAKTVPSARKVNDGPHAGQLAFDFEIFEQARWDNGSPVTAEDVISTVKMLLVPQLDNDFDSYFEHLSAIEPDAANPRKFTVYFRQNFILALETICQTPIYPAYHYDPGKKLAQIPFSMLLDKTQKAALMANADLQAFANEFKDGKYAINPEAISASGPYRLVSLNEQGSIIVKKTNWWGDEVVKVQPLLAAYPDTIIYQAIRDDAAVETMLRNGQLDVVAGSFSADKFFMWKQDGGINNQYDFQVIGAATYSRCMFNLRRDVFKDKAVRQALAHCINYDYLVNTIQKGLAVRTVSAINPGKPYYAKDITPYDFNLDKAKTLLKDAGWADSNGDGVLDKTINGRRQDLTFTLLAPMQLSHIELTANSFKNNAEQVGIRINIESATNINDRTRKRDFDAAFSATSLFPGHFDFHQRYHSANDPEPGDNRYGYINPLTDSLSMIHRTTADDAERNKLYQAIQKQVYEDVPEIFLYSASQKLITSKQYIPVLYANRPGYVEALFKRK